MPCLACKGRGYTRPFIGTGNPQQRPCEDCGATGMDPAELQEFKEQAEALSIAALTPWPPKGE